MEKWENIKDTDGRYAISTEGRVMSNIRSQILKPHIASHGYEVVNIAKKKGDNQQINLVHRLMAETYLGLNGNGFELVVDHIDDDKLNNKLSNLRLVSNRKNTSKNRKGKSKYAGVCLDRGYIHARIQVNGKSLHLGSFKTELEAHEAYKNKLKEISP